MEILTSACERIVLSVERRASSKAAADDIFDE
jgi:hypothetical protein